MPSLPANIESGSLVSVGRGPAAVMGPPEVVCKGAVRPLSAALHVLHETSQVDPDVFAIAGGFCENALPHLTGYPGAAKHKELAGTYAQQLDDLRRDTSRAFREHITDENRGSVLVPLCNRHLQLGCDVEALMLEVAKCIGSPVRPNYPDNSWLLQNMLKSCRSCRHVARICVPVRPSHETPSPDEPSRPHSHPNKTFGPEPSPEEAEAGLVEDLRQQTLDDRVCMTSSDIAPASGSECASDSSCGKQGSTEESTGKAIVSSSMAFFIACTLSFCHSAQCF